jgi:hypothetical protein
MEAEAFPSKGQIVAVSASQRKGIKKSNLPECKLLEDEGLDGDAHAGDWHRQVSLMPTPGTGTGRLVSSPWKVSIRFGEKDLMSPLEILPKISPPLD